MIKFNTRTPPDVVLDLPVAAYDAGHDVRIEAVRQLDGRVLWKVHAQGSVLAKTGEWEREPIPSSCDDEFLTRYRFDTPQEALACLRCVDKSSEQEANSATPLPDIWLVVDKDGKVIECNDEAAAVSRASRWAITDPQDGPYRVAKMIDSIKMEKVEELVDEPTHQNIPKDQD